MEQVGKEGVITVKEGKSLDDQLRTGPRDANRSRLPVAVLRHRPNLDGGVLEDAYILIHEKKISVVKDLMPILEAIATPANHS